MPGKDGHKSVAELEECGNLVIDLPSEQGSRGRGLSYPQPSSGSSSGSSVHPPPPEQPPQFPNGGGILAAAYTPEQLLLAHQAQQQAALFNTGNAFLNFHYAAANQLLYSEAAAAGLTSRMTPILPAALNPANVYPNYFVNPAASIFYQGGSQAIPVSLAAAAATGFSQPQQHGLIGGLTPEQAASLLTPLPFVSLNSVQAVPASGSQSVAPSQTTDKRVSTSIGAHGGGNANNQHRQQLPGEFSKSGKSASGSTESLSRGTPSRSDSRAGTDGGLLNSPEAVEKHITKLIENNEAILKPSTVQPRAKRSARFGLLPSTVSQQSSGSNSSGEENGKSGVKKTGSLPATHPSDPLPPTVVGRVAQAIPNLSAQQGPIVTVPTAPVELNPAQTVSRDSIQLHWLRLQQQLLANAPVVSPQQFASVENLARAQVVPPPQQLTQQMPSPVVVKPPKTTPNIMGPCGTTSKASASTGPKLYKCAYCHIEFRSVESLQMHENRCVGHRSQLDDDATTLALSLTSLGDVDSWRKIEGTGEGGSSTPGGPTGRGKRPASQGSSNGANYALPFKKRHLDPSLAQPSQLEKPPDSDLCPTPPLTIERVPQSQDRPRPTENINDSINAVLNSVGCRSQECSSQPPSDEKLHKLGGLSTTIALAKPPSQMSPRVPPAPVTNLVFITPEKVLSALPPATKVTERASPVASSSQFTGQSVSADSTAAPVLHSSEALLNVSLAKTVPTTPSTRSNVPMLTKLEPIISTPGLCLSDCEKTFNFKPYIPPSESTLLARMSPSIRAGISGGMVPLQGNCVSSSTPTTSQDDHTTVASSPDDGKAGGRSRKNFVKDEKTLVSLPEVPTNLMAKRTGMCLLTYSTLSEKGHIFPQEQSEIVYWRARSVSPIDAKLNILHMGTPNLRDNSSLNKQPHTRYTTAPSSENGTNSRVVTVSSDGTASHVTEGNLGRDLKVNGVEKEEERTPKVAESAPEEDGHLEKGDELLGDTKVPGKIRIFNGGFKSLEPYTYTKGRGRGAYVCELCGIRCAKPSILKKHIRSHTNERPFKCSRCGFLFKTKGNLTKHLRSRAHKEKLDYKEDSYEVHSSVENLDGNRTSGDGQSDSEVCDSSDERQSAMKPRVKFCTDWEIPRTPPPRFGAVPEEPERSESAPPYFYAHDYSQTDESSDVGMVPKSSKSLAKCEPITVEIPASSQQQTCIPPGISQLYLASVGEKPTCELCGQTFKNAGALRLHMNIHYLDNTAKRYEYRCSQCSCGFRSRAQLQKHQNSEHGGHPQEGTLETPEKMLTNGQTDEGNGGTFPGHAGSITPKSHSNPRSFECLDCSTAFRIKGHMAKHLRAKVHIMKLESLGKIPVGSFAKLEETNANLNEIDTSTAENALLSIRALVARYMGDEKMEITTPTTVTPGTGIEPITTCDGGSAAMESSDRKQLRLDLSVTPVSNSSAPTDGGGGLETAVSTPCKSTASTPDLCCQNGSISQTCEESLKGCVVAGVWIPPVPPRETLKFGGSTKLCSMSKLGLEGEENTFTSEFGGSSGGLMNGSSGHLECYTCKLCGADFRQEMDMQVHLQADHLVLLDGKDFKCPRPNCARVYPNRKDLRSHIEAHFCNPTSIGGGFIPTPSDSPTVDMGSVDSIHNAFACTSGATGGGPKGSRLIKSTAVKVEEGSTPTSLDNSFGNPSAAMLNNSSPFGSDTTSENSQDGCLVTSPSSSPLVPTNVITTAKLLPIKPIPSKGGIFPAVSFNFAASGERRAPSLELGGEEETQRPPMNHHDSPGGHEDAPGCALSPSHAGSLVAGKPVPQLCKPAEHRQHQSLPPGFPLPWGSLTAQGIPAEYMLKYFVARPFICEYCDAGYQTESALGDHLRFCGASRASACSN